MPYKCGSRKCDLCLAEKEAIARFEGVGSWNKRTELLSLTVNIELNLL